MWEKAVAYPTSPSKLVVKISGLGATKTQKSHPKPLRLTPPLDVAIKTLNASDTLVNLIRIYQCFFTTGSGFGRRKFAFAFAFVFLTNP